MEKSKHASSIFSQKLDRAASTAYFLGAVVPLLAFAFVVQRYVLTDLSDAIGTLGMISLVTSVGMLSLGSFFILRITTRSALRQMDGDNQRLTLLLDVSTSLGNTREADVASWPGAMIALQNRYPDVQLVLPGHGEPGTVALLTHTVELLVKAHP